jgi:hypothetical protein
MKTMSIHALIITIFSTIASFNFFFHIKIIKNIWLNDWFTVGQYGCTKSVLTNMVCCGRSVAVRGRRRRGGRRHNGWLRSSGWAAVGAVSGRQRAAAGWGEWRLAVAEERRAERRPAQKMRAAAGCGWGEERGEQSGGWLREWGRRVQRWPVPRKVT